MTNTINEAVSNVLKRENEAVSKYVNGKTDLLGFLVGQTMKELGGAADPKAVSEQL